MESLSNDAAAVLRELLIEDLANFGIGAGVLGAKPSLFAPPRTVQSDRAEVMAMHLLRPLLRDLSKRGLLNRYSGKSE